MQRRLFLRIAGGGTVAAASTLALAGCSSALPPQAIAAWQGPGNEPDVRRWVLAHAILAPHSHNLQSWLVDLSEPDTITLFIDRGRLLPETDPFSRQMLMSQGTFLELLDQAAREKGLRADVELFPQGVFGPTAVDARPTARVQLVQDAGVARDPLFQQVFKRRTNREAYLPAEPSAAAMQAIAGSTPLPGMRSGFVRATMVRNATNQITSAAKK
ncbi:MAG: twin-arginine translocation pathway signal protein, partial [Hydrogenophaga sp.]